MSAERRHDQEELPHGLSADDLDRLGIFMRRELRAIREEIDSPKVSYTHGSAATWFLGLLVSISVALNGWELKTIDDLQKAVAVLQCQVSVECKHALLERGAP